MAADLISQQHLDLVFEQRNKNYGAFIIRRRYGRNVIIAFGIALAVITFFLILPIILEALKPKEEIPEKEVTIVKVTDIPPPPRTVPPPPVKVEPVKTL